jgi:hypothetical protein
MPKGGYRPTAPQNNTGVSATGGAGSKAGQPNRYMSGGKYGEGKAMAEQQQGAPMAAAPTGTSASPAAASMPPMPQMPSIGSLLDPTNNPEEPITAGVDFGPGPGSDAMPKGLSANTRPDENAALVAQYLPDLIQAASYKDAPDSFKRFVNYLASK